MPVQGRVGQGPLDPVGKMPNMPLANTPNTPTSANQPTAAQFSANTATMPTLSGPASPSLAHGPHLDPALPKRNERPQRMSRHSSTSSTSEVAHGSPLGKRKSSHSSADVGTPVVTRRKSKTPSALSPVAPPRNSMLYSDLTNPPSCPPALRAHDILTLEQQSREWHTLMSTLALPRPLLLQKLVAVPPGSKLSPPQPTDVLCVLHLETGLSLCPLQHLNPYIHHDMLEIGTSTYNTAFTLTTCPESAENLWPTIAADVVAFFASTSHKKVAFPFSAIFIENFFTSTFLPKNLLYNSEKSLFALYGLGCPYQHFSFYCFRGPPSFCY